MPKYLQFLCPLRLFFFALFQNSYFCPVSVLWLFMFNLFGLFALSPFALFFTIFVPSFWYYCMFHVLLPLPSNCPLAALLLPSLPSLCPLFAHFVPLFCPLCALFLPFLHVSCVVAIALFMPSSFPLLHLTLNLQERAKWGQKKGNGNNTWTIQEWQKEGTKRAKRGQNQKL